MAFNLNDLMTATSKEEMRVKREEQFQDASFRDVKISLESKMKLMARNMIQIGFLLKIIRDKELYREEGYDNFAECAFKEFGLTESSTYRFIKANNEYSINGNSLEIDERYVLYNSSQLIEMINMPLEQREKITPDMSVKVIRERKRADAESEELSGEFKCFTESQYEPDPVVMIESKTEKIKGESYIDAEYKEVESKEVINAELESEAKLPILDLKNDKQRFDFIDSYSEWHIWIQVPQTDEIYYRYDLSDGTAIVVRDYLCTIPDWRRNKSNDTHERGRAEFYLLKQGMTFKDSETNRSAIVDHLKHMK